MSVETNIVEGYALSTPGNFRRHLRIALGSAAEAEILLEISEEVGYLGPAHVAPLREKADRAIAVLVGLLKSLRKHKP